VRFDPKLITRFLSLSLFFESQHGLRVLKIIGISDLIEALVFCDYARPDNDFGCKPELGFFNEASPFFLFLSSPQLARISRTRIYSLASLLPL